MEEDPEVVLECRIGHVEGSLVAATDVVSLGGFPAWYVARICISALMLEPSCLMSQTYIQPRMYKGITATTTTILGTNKINIKFRGE